MSRLLLVVVPDPPPAELDVTGFDPGADLERRTGQWGHRLASHDLVELTRFAAGLAVAEAEAWDRDDPVIATRAFEDRRFLAGDRMVHWAVPWLDSAEQAHPEMGDDHRHIRDLLLDLGDRLRLAPDLGVMEGTTLPGHDSLGPLEPDRPFEQWLCSLLSGLVLMRRERAPASSLSDPREVTRLAEEYRQSSNRWQELARRHPGTARLWLDLAARAGRTADLLGQQPV